MDRREGGESGSGVREQESGWRSFWNAEGEWRGNIYFYRRSGGGGGRGRESVRVGREDGRCEVTLGGMFSLSLLLFGVRFLGRGFLFCVGNICIVFFCLF